VSSTTTDVAELEPCVLSEDVLSPSARATDIQNEQMPPQSILNEVLGQKADDLELVDLAFRGLHPAAIDAVVQECRCVTELDLSGNGIASIAAGAFQGGLPCLKLLLLSDNALRSLPSSLCTLSRLETLQVNNNSLEHLPPNLGTLMRLEHLAMCGNHLKSLPPSIGQLSELKTLRLAENRLQALPVEIQGLLRLRWLYISNNQLQQLPAEIGDLRSLQHLTVEGNSLKSLPSEIGKLGAMLSISLCNNQLQTIPPELLQLPSLRALYVRENKLTRLPEETCQCSLERLQLSGNPMEHPPISVCCHGIKAIRTYLQDETEPSDQAPVQQGNALQQGGPNSPDFIPSWYAVNGHVNSPWENKGPEWQPEAQDEL